MGLLDLAVNPRTLGQFHGTPEVRLLPSPSITWSQRYYEPVRHPSAARPVPRGRPVGPHAHRWGFPCCVQSPCADMPSPLPRWDRRRDRVVPLKPATAAFPMMWPDRLPHCAFRGLLGVHACYSLPARGTAKTVLSIEGFGAFVTSTTAPIATGWSNSCRVGIAPTEDRRLSTAHNGVILDYPA